MKVKIFLNDTTIQVVNINKETFKGNLQDLAYDITAAHNKFQDPKTIKVKYEVTN
jgi:hypothetical protein